MAYYNYKPDNWDEKQKQKQTNKNKMKTKDIFMIISAIIFISLCNFWGMPVLSIGFFGLPAIIFFTGLLIFFFDFEDGEPAGSWRVWLGGIAIVVGFIWFVIVPIFSSAMFRSSDLRQLIGNIDEKQFSNDISPIDPSRMVLIDYESAAKLGDKKLVDRDAALGSVVTIGKYTHQKIGNDLYYAAPLNHTGFWKWRENKQGTPGYILVNAHNQKDVRLVKEVNGRPIHLKYQSGGCFGDYLPRHIYKNGYKGYGQFEYEFEIDNDFNPWYVVPLYEKKVGFNPNGKDVVKILIVNPETGEIKEYTPETLPTWVDRAQPKALVTTQFDNWGEWVHGWPNWAHKDQLKLSQETQLIYGEDGVCYLYSGVTSVGQDAASVGFILTNGRSKKTTFYHAGGANESSAQASAQGKVQQMGYKASRPRPYNINGVWTYVMALKDNEGLIKAVGLVSYSNYEIVGTGETIMDAIRSYKSALNNRGDNLAVSEDNTHTPYIGIVSRMGMDTKDGQFYYYFIFQSMPQTLFVSTSSISNEVPLTKIGDRVKIMYTAGNEGEISIENFDNLELNFIKTPAQVRVDSTATKVEKRINDETLNTRVKAKLDNMTEEEKLKLLNK